MLEGGAQHHARVVAEDVLGAVAVVDVEIDDGDPCQAVRLQGMRGGDGDVVEEAEAHGLVAGGVVAGRAAGDEGVVHLAAHHPVHRHHRAAGGMAGGVQAVRVHAGVGVERVQAFAGRGGFDEVDVGGVMHPQQLAALHPRGFEMRQIIEQVGGMQPVIDGAQARGAFRMPVAHVVLEAGRGG